VSLEFVRADVLQNVESRLIERYGGLPGVRDGGALESALAWALLRNHPFMDGNKRAAFAALTMFLELNGCRLTCSEVEETAMVLRAAGSEIAEEEWTAWVARSVAAK
jgi:death-on-curing protein